MDFCFKKYKNKIYPKIIKKNYRCCYTIQTLVNKFILIKTNLFVLFFINNSENYFVIFQFVGGIFKINIRFVDLCILYQYSEIKLKNDSLVLRFSSLSNKIDFIALGQKSNMLIEIKHCHGNNDVI